VQPAGLLKGDHDSLQKKGQTWYCTHACAALMNS
jgi:hypothetical protein